MSFDVAIIGAGIVGLATARALAGASLIVVEAEGHIAAHQTGHNSGVIHSGLYYKPGSAKAVNCAEGRELMYRYCSDHGIPHDRCGKIVVASTPEEVSRLDELERRGRANVLTGITRLDAAGLREHEPHVVGIAGLHVPQTGIVDYKRVADAFADDVRQAGGEVRVNAKVIGIKRDAIGFVLESTAGDIACRTIVNCAGLQSDRVARIAGVDPVVRIVPFRGEYYDLVPAARHLVRNLIYPVPDPRFPFLGVHFTRMIGGGVEAGPNAVLAFRREGYRRTSFRGRDVAAMLSYRGFWRMAGRYYGMGLSEMHRSWSKAAFVRSLRRLVPELRSTDIVRGGAGVRAQAVSPDGRTLDDFHIVEAPRMVHVLNAPSPAATASIRIGQTIADRVRPMLPTTVTRRAS